VIRTNLSTRPFYNERAVHVWLLVAALVVTAGLCGVAWRAWGLQIDEGDRYRVLAARQHALTVEFGLDKPKWQQYLIYLKNLLHGNMGVSFAYHQPVSHLLIQDLKNTIPMVTVGTVAAIVIGVFTGVLSAWRRGSAPDHVGTHLAIFFYAFPTQWLGLMLLILFAGILPAGGMSNPFVLGAEPFWQHLGDVGAHMLLPAATLMLTAYGSYTLVVRSSMLERKISTSSGTSAGSIGRSAMAGWAVALIASPSRRSCRLSCPRARCRSL